MPRKYEVWIDGRLLVVCDKAHVSTGCQQVLTIEVERPEELGCLADTFAARPELAGVHAFGPSIEQVWAWFKERYTLVEAAGGAVTDEQGRLLAIHRLGRWDLPKGKVEPGEAIADAAVREVREECGLKQLRIIKPLLETWHTYERKGPKLKCTHWFHMAGDAAEPLKAQAEEDIDAVRWLDAQGLEALRNDTYASILQVLNAWEQERPGRA